MKNDFSEHLRMRCHPPAVIVVKLYPRKNQHFLFEAGIVVLMMRKTAFLKVSEYSSNIWYVLNLLQGSLIVPYSIFA
jgi:hypothetical protein